MIADTVKGIVALMVVAAVRRDHINLRAANRRSA